ncbi:EAL domain-containing protein [Aquincola sp. S2]|uniref:EAL domain-containing protein n=1 Tax=Pseudaquabacterium terrae TaxID=2732868 RepID=A0ABX2EE67_9BURK|nr:EAL domain-containing protein [Aquabacterium terrae]NRF66905.1 EAL domain-containing protein [Aquabacterium terrae]
MYWPRLSIRTTVLLAIAAAVLIPAAALWHVDQRLIREVQQPLIQQHRQALMVMASNVLVEPLWTIDSNQVQAALKRTLDEPSVLAVRLAERRPLAPPIVLKRPGITGDAGQPMRTEIVREGEVLADLELRFDEREIERILSARRAGTLQLVALQVLLATAVLLGVFYRRLLRPIQRLKQQASAIAHRAELAPLKWHGEDELGELGQHLNEVHGQIHGLFSELESKKAALETMALHDPLTGLANRTLFAELTLAAVAAARRDNGKLALLFIDLDRFKSVNDQLGHAAGDDLLIALAGRLRATVRESDVVCRHSGDEFTILLHDAHTWDEVAATADRLLKAIEAPMTVREQEASVSASIGIALFPDDAADYEELLRHADTAMYAAKRLGRARHSFFRSEFNSQLQATLRLEKELQYALLHDEFVLHYQPLVAAVGGTVLGCEALIRWMHPVRGMVPPLQFIPAAEQSGLISELGNWTVRAACAQIARWKAAGLNFGTVAVNVSALEFRHHRLVDTLTQAMADFGVQPDELEIELTESVLMTDTETTQRIVERLHALGLRLVVDDFGTGYSSLAYLKHLRPSKIKIDRSFVRDLPADEDDRVLVRAIVQLARALGIAVVAEGVETEPQREFLCGIGCTALQGFLLARPQPAAEFELIVRGGLLVDATRS